LQGRKESFKKTYVGLNQYKGQLLKRQKEIIDRTAELTAGQLEIKTELEKLASESTQIANKLTSANTHKQYLYQDSFIIDAEMDLLLGQKSGLKKDLVTCKEGLSTQQTTWDNFKVSLAQARKSFFFCLNKASCKRVLAPVSQLFLRSVISEPLVSL